MNLFPILPTEQRYKEVNATALMAADKIFKLKEQNKTWECLEEIVKIWSQVKRSEYKSYLIDLDYIKGTMKDPKFGTTRTRGSNLRRLIDMPSSLVFWIRKVFTAEELPMDKKFFIKWSRMFPKMMVVNKI